MIDLSRFSNTDDGREFIGREFIGRPFYCDDRVVVTDGFVMLAIPQFADIVPPAQQVLDTHSSTLAGIRKVVAASLAASAIQETPRIDLATVADGLGICEYCNGTGSRWSIECDQCDGAGEFTHGTHVYECLHCHGGRLFNAPRADDSRHHRCYPCNGSGRGDSRSTIACIGSEHMGISGAYAALVYGILPDAEIETAPVGNHFYFRDPATFVVGAIAGLSK